MIEPSIKKQGRHLAIELGMNFSGLTRHALKLILFLLGNKNRSTTWKTKIVTLLDNPKEVPLVTVELLEKCLCEEYPELKQHFDVIAGTLKNSEEAES